MDSVLKPTPRLQLAHHLQRSICNRHILIWYARDSIGTSPSPRRWAAWVFICLPPHFVCAVSTRPSAAPYLNNMMPYFARIARIVRLPMQTRALSSLGQASGPSVSASHIRSAQAREPAQSTATSSAVSNSACGDAPIDPVDEQVNVQNALTGEILGPTGKEPTRCVPLLCHMLHSVRQSLTINHLSCICFFCRLYYFYHRPGLETGNARASALIFEHVRSRAVLYNTCII